MGTKVMEQFNTRTYALETPADRHREEDVRPGPPFRLAAENLSARVLGLELDEGQATKAGMAFTTSLGCRGLRSTCCCGAGSAGAHSRPGLARGASMSLLLDETITPAIGASGPNDGYPVSTHVRAFAAHLVFGLAVAGVMEAGAKLLGRR